MGSLLLEGRDGAGQPDDLGGQAPLASLQDPPVGIGEAGEVERQQVVEGALGLIEAGLELPGRGPEGRDGRGAGGGHRAPRIAPQRLAGGGVGGDAPRLEEGLGLARAQTVARDGLGQARLLGARERREGMRGGGGESAVIDVGGHGRSQPAAEHQAAIDPAAAAAEQLGDLRRREVILVGERADHACLVHGAQRAARGVGLEQPGLAHDAGRVLDDHRHVRVAVATPACQALEPIEHLVGAGAGRGDAQRQRGEPARGLGARAAQGRQRGGELRDRQGEQGAHGRAASRGSSW
ncbi:MAG TPA: hypothetical protein VMT79_10760 [Candidatus Binatia bacterium]|nr:hypothetical protein [Candidatus Binatia bacterium]